MPAEQRRETHLRPRSLCTSNHPSLHRCDLCPPSSSPQQFESFWENAYRDVVSLTENHHLTPIILTDANAHCITGFDKFRTLKIPDRDAPYRHQSRHNRRTLLTRAARRGSCLERLTHLNNYCILNNRTRGDNSDYTFQGHQPDPTDPENSYRRTNIDYIIVPSQNFNDVLEFNILTDSYLQFNTDHNILHMIAHDSTPSPDTHNPDGLDADAILFPKFALTDHDIRDAYKAHLSDLLKPWVKHNYVRLVASHKSAGTPHQVTADEIHRQILAIIREAASAVLGTCKRPDTRQTQSNSKPLWWTPALHTLTKTKTRLRARISRLNRRNPHTPTLKHHLATKLNRVHSALRAASRTAKRTHDQRYYNTIQSEIHKSLKDPERSNATAWSLVHKRRRTHSSIHTIPAIIRTSNVTTDNPRDTAIQFTKSWANISRLDTNDPMYDTEHTRRERDKFTQWHASLTANPDIPRAPRDDPFSVSETFDALNSLKALKRHGSDGVPPDLLKHGGYWLAKALTLAHNFYLRHSVHPSSWNTNPANPLYKSGARTDPLNYRIIAFMTSLCKVYDCTLAKRLVSWAEDNHLIAPTQYGYRAQTETCDLWYMYTNTIRERSANDLKTYVVSLDVKKAFPSVPRFLIWNMCHERKLGSRLLLALINMAESARLWLTIPSATQDDSYPLSQGVREGSVTSPILYILFADSAIRAIRSARLGLHIRGIYTGASLFADDLSMLLASPEDVNKALAILTERGFLTRTTYNAAKTDVVIFGETAEERLAREINPNLAPTFVMANTVLHPTNTLTLLGLRLMNTISFTPHLKHILYCAPAQANDMYHAGATNNGLNLHTGLYMWQMIYLPKFTHALHIWYDSSMSDILDDTILQPLIKLLPIKHKLRTLKSCQHLLIAVELNILVSEQQYSHALLSYAARLPNKPAHNPARRLYETLRYENHQSHQRITGLLKDLSLDHSHMDSPSWPDVLKQQLFEQAKSQLSRAVYDSHNVRSYMALLQPDTPPSPFRRRHANAKHVLVLRLQLAPLATMLTDDQTAICTRCSLATPDTLVHWLLQCPALNVFRANLDSALGRWSTEPADSLNLAHNTNLSRRWASIPLVQQIQALQGEIPPLLLDIFKTPPLPHNTSPPTPQPLLMHNMLRRLVNTMDAYCKHTFEAIRHHAKPQPT